MSTEFIHKWKKGTSAMTVLLLHGTGGDEDDLLGIGGAIAPGANLLSPRGKVSENGANRFFARNGHGVFNPDEIAERAGEFATWLSSAAAQYGFDASKLYAVGYSNGANMAYVTMMLHPGSIAGAVLLRPMVVMEPEPMPDMGEAPILISAGTQDSMLPPGGTEALVDLLTRANARVEVARHNANHGLTPDDFSVTKYWLQNR